MITLILLVALGHQTSFRHHPSARSMRSGWARRRPAATPASWKTALRSNRSDERSDAEATVANYRAWALGSLSTQSHWFFASLEIERHLMEVFTDAPNWATKLAEADPRVRDDILRTFFDKIFGFEPTDARRLLRRGHARASVWLLGIYLPSQEAGCARRSSRAEPQGRVA